MLEGYVAAQVRRANRNLLAVNSVVVLLVLGIVVLTFPYIMECLRGPFHVSIEDIARGAKKDLPHRFLRVDIDPAQLDRVGYQISGGKDHQNEYYHFLHVDNNRILIIRSYSEQLPAHLTGSVATLSGDVSLRVLRAAAGNIQGDVLPIMLDLSSYRLGLWIMLLFGTPALALAVWNLKKAVTRIGDPGGTMVRHLAVIGPPEEIAIAIDAEVREGGAKVGKVLAMRSWLIRPTTYSTDLLYLGDIAWAYKHETVHKSYGVTTNRTYSTVIYDVRGKRWNFPLTLAQVEGLLKELATRVPWAYIGFNAELQKAWQKNRKEVLAAIEERKRQATLAAAAEPAKEEIAGDIPPVQGA